MAKRLFRRRTNGEWFRDNAYLGVSLIALAGAAVGWAAMFEERGASQSEYASAELLTGSDPTAVPESEPPTVAADESPAVADSAQSSATVTTAPPTATAPPSTTDTAAPAAAETKAAPRSASVVPRAASRTAKAHGKRMAQRHANAKSRTVARSSRRVRTASADAIVGRHHTGMRRQGSVGSKTRAIARMTRRDRVMSTAAVERRSAARRPRAREREQRLALASPTPSRASVYEDYLDRPYSPPLPSERRSPRPPKIDPAWQAEIERGITKMECTRSFRAFGAMRRIPTDC